MKNWMLFMIFALLSAFLEVLSFREIFPPISLAWFFGYQALALLAICPAVWFFIEWAAE